MLTRLLTQKKIEFNFSAKNLNQEDSKTNVISTKIVI